jgi:D-sedoheptulose 7-phosphate isomerase
LKASILEAMDRTLGVMQQLRASDEIASAIETAARRVGLAFQSGHKLMLAGNGGSAADAQHMAGEFVGRFAHDRPGLPALALGTDSSVLTAVANDYGFDQVFARQVQAIGAKGDVFWAYSTSGRSRNILLAMRAARDAGLVVVGLTGQAGWAEPALCDVSIAIPSTETPRIQEGHAVVGHIICGLVEAMIFPRAA